MTSIHPLLYGSLVIYAITELLVWVITPLTGVMRSAFILYPSMAPKGPPASIVVPAGSIEMLYGSPSISTMVEIKPITTILSERDFTQTWSFEYTLSVATVHEVPGTGINTGKAVGGTYTTPVAVGVVMTEVVGVDVVDVEGEIDVET